jgi:ubiquinone/menaquinone biosynthesis C-methylase UbiE
MRDTPPSDAPILRKYRTRVFLLLLFAFLLVALLSTTLRTVNTLDRLAVVEAERDRWQRPRDVLQALGADEGKAVADLGCGSGYFALKLSERVGPGGRVLAVDVRWQPLLILRLRALLRGEHNLTLIWGQPDDPHLPTKGLDALLIANTYHELTDRRAILAHLFQALRVSGRLVVVDPAPEPAPEGQGEAHRHEDVAVAEDELRQAGFEIVSRDDRFAQGPTGPWWLIVASRPGEMRAPRAGN